MSCKKCSTEGGCPFASSEESEIIYNFGCLPEPVAIMALRIKKGKTWACHENTRKPCLGALNALKEHGLPFKIIDKELVDEGNYHKYMASNEEIDEVYNLLRGLSLYKVV